MALTKLKIKEAAYRPAGPKGKLKLFIRIKNCHEPIRVRDTRRVSRKKLEKTFQPGKKVPALTSEQGAILAFKVGKEILLQTL